MSIIENGSYSNNIDFISLVNNHCKDKNLSKQELATRLGVSRSAVSQYLSNSYSNPTTIENRLIPYLREQGVKLDNEYEQTNPFTNLTTDKKLYKSTDARRIAAICSACQMFAEFGVIAGKSGYGKTFTLKQYAGMPKVAYIECDDTMGRRDLVEALESVLGLNQGYGSLYRRTEVIKNHLNANPGYLIIVDEADKLISKSTQKKMEILRKLIDKAKVGIVIAGEPQLIPMLIAYDHRLANRGSKSYVLNGLDKNEAAEYLSAYPMEQQAQNELISRACNNRNGCFRLLDRTLNNVIRLVNDRGATKITLDMIEEASDMMMI